MGASAVRAVRRTMTVAGLLLAGVALAACAPLANSVRDATPNPVATSPAASAPAASATPPEASDDTATFAVVGDSITDANSPDLPGGVLGTESWARYVVEAGLGFAGGWAEWGAPTSLMADSVSAVDADVLVILAGTNDLALGVPFADTTEHLDRIVATVGIDEVVISSIPPIDALPEAPPQYNAQLASLAGQRGWRFVDASAGLRTDDGRFIEGMAYDGLHPSEQGARVLGEAIAAELLGR